MKIILINGSYRKNGTTAFILNKMYQQLKTYHDTEIQMIHVSDLELNYCVGCGMCYQTGACIYHDDIEKLSLEINQADGIILGSPTYASNVSGQMKVIIDRGHFIMEQLLYGKYAISVSTYENYGGWDCVKILNRLLSYSGAKISGTLSYRKKFQTNLLEDTRLTITIQKLVNKIYHDINKKHPYILQKIKHLIIFRIGIQPFILQNSPRYDGVLKHWKDKGIL